VRFANPPQVRLAEKIESLKEKKEFLTAETTNNREIETQITAAERVQHKCAAGRAAPLRKRRGNRCACNDSGSRLASSRCKRARCSRTCGADDGA
jgi:hypothetical protein